MRGLRRSRRLEQPHGYALKIFPEGLPLEFLVPDVGALEQRNEEALGLHEDGLWGADLGVHNNAVLSTNGSETGFNGPLCTTFQAVLSAYRTFRSLSSRIGVPMPRAYI
jgi:hypothetical protein